MKLESCVRAVLYDYRYSKKDFYECSLLKIKRAFRACMKSFSCVNDKQTGGGRRNMVTDELDDLNMDRITLHNKIKRLESKL